MTERQFGRQKQLSWTIEWILKDEHKSLANCIESLTILQAFTNAVPKKLQQTQKGKDNEPNEAPQVGPGDAQQDLPTADAYRLNSTSVVDDDVSSKLHFYLHRPDLPSRQHSITHLAPETILGDALRGRLVLEFPTVYALPESPEQLPENFRLATDSVREGSLSDVSHTKHEEAAVQAATAQSEVNSVS